MDGTKFTLIGHRAPTRVLSALSYVRYILELAGVLALICAGQGVWAQAASERLEDFFREVRSLDASFTQEVFDEDAELVQVSSGTVELLRPGRFRWEYERPDEQLILADGKRLWTYDPELEQATVKPIEEALGAAPIMLLTGDRPLIEQFSIEQAGAEDGLQWALLNPKVRDMEFNRIKLGLGAQGVERMVLNDQFGQTTVISLHEIRTNVEIDPARFKFAPPRGTDVIDATGSL